MRRQDNASTNQITETHAVTNLLGPFSL